MDLLNRLAMELIALKEQRATKINDLYSPEDAASGNLANAIIADMINLLEQLYLILNIPQDGFMSMTPDRPANGPKN